MTDIEAKALALVNEICLENGVIPYAKLPNIEASEALCRTIEQHEAFKQEVSDALKTFKNGNMHTMHDYLLEQFIIPAPKPDPLLDMAKMMGYFNTAANAWADDVRAALDAAGFEIREKNDD